MRVVQGGNELCRIAGFDRGEAVFELKASIEAEAGLVSALTRLIHPESFVELQDHLTLEDAGMPSEQALAEGVIQLYAQTLKRVVVADELQIAPGEVTDSKLAVLCDSIREDPTDILVLCGCRRVTNISCLIQLSTISHLDMSRCNLGAKGGFQGLLAGVIKNMGAISSVNLLENDIGTDQAEALASILKEHPTLKSLCGNSGEETELDMSGKGMDAGDTIILVPEIIDNGALTKFDISKNVLRVEGGMALAAGLEGNQVITELNIGSNTLGLNAYHSADASGVVAIADVIGDMGALTKFDISSNDIRAEGVKALAAGLQGNQVITELNISDNDLGRNYHQLSDTSGIVAFADAIPDMGALFSVDVSNNDIPVDKLQEIDQAVRSNRLRVIREDSNKSLSEIDLSSRYLDAKDAIVVAEYIKDNGAMTRLDISENYIRATGCKVLAEALTGNQVMQELNVARNQLALKADAQSLSDVDMSGVTALADVISGMGELTVLNLAENGIKAKHSHQHALSHTIDLRDHSCDECRQSCTEAYRGGECDYDCCAACNNSDCPVVALAHAIEDMGVLSCNDGEGLFEQRKEVLYFDALSGINADILAMAAFDEGLTICRCGAMKSDHQVKGALIKLDISTDLHISHFGVVSSTGRCSKRSR
jgi:Ran GTPase-activating protein (RanGAP) involved in mRNA processing and transport